MPNRCRKQWESLGRIDPYWAVLTDSRKKNGKWDSVAFFKTGAAEIHSIMETIRLLDVTLHYDVAIDYGCGVGRLSRPLSRLFHRVLGIDISESMLTEARNANRSFGNIQFLHTNGDNIAFIESNTADFIYSNITLQHTSKPIQGSLIKEFCRVLRPGGVLVFQALSRKNIKSPIGFIHLVFSNAILNLAKRILHGKWRVMEIHTIPKKDVLDIFKENAVSLLKTEKSNSAGKPFISYRYYAVKSTSPK